MLNTRKNPGKELSSRLGDLFDYQLPVVCGMGFSQAKKIKSAYNSTYVKANTAVPRAIVNDLSDVVGHWGALYVHGHKTSAPGPQDEPGLRIEPFMMNGPHATEYARRLPSLGRDIGRYLVDACRARGDAAVYAVNRNAPAPKRVTQ